MEFKLNGTVAKKSHSTDEKEEIQVGDVIAAYLSFWNKWIRGQIKEINENGLFYVWAVDYGVPLVLNASQIIKLPAIYAKMNSKMQRIHVGGLINCIPAESTYDLEKDESVLVEQTNWSEKAIGIMQKIISSANHLKFDETKEINLMNRTHRFGNLKCLRPDGTWIDLNKSLSNALVAKNSTNWLAYVNRLDSIRQPEWKTVAGKPIQAIFVLSPVSPEDYKILHETSTANNQTNEQTATKANIVESNNPIDSCNDKNSNSNSNNKQPIETTNVNVNHCNQGQASYAKPRSRPHQRLSNGFMNNRSWSNQNGHMGNMNHWPRQHDRNAYDSQFPSRWHSNGKLENQRYREEVEYFEASLRKPTTPIKRDDSPSSSDDSKDEPNEKQTANAEAKEQTETKQSDENSNTTSQNGPADNVATETGQEETATVNSSVTQEELKEAKNAS